MAGLGAGAGTAVRNWVTKRVPGAVLGAGLGLAFSVPGIRERVRSGQSPLRAIAGEAFWLLPTFYMGGGLIWGGMKAMAWMSIPTLPALGAAGAAYFSNTGTITHRRSTPFSQRFEHSDTGFALMQRGMELMGTARGALGGEGYLQHRRYGGGSR